MSKLEEIEPLSLESDVDALQICKCRKWIVRTAPTCLVLLQLCDQRNLSAPAPVDVRLCIDMCLARPD
jgi:hypothetical protein